jgi:hypothetical protein
MGAEMIVRKLSSIMQPKAYSITSKIQNFAHFLKRICKISALECPRNSKHNKMGSKHKIGK